MDDMEVDDMEIDDVTMEMNDVIMEMDVPELGVEDYGALISSSCNASSSFLCSKRFMTPGSDQLNVDSCVSFTLSASLGALVVLDQPDTYDVPEFSRQEIVDCLPIKPGGTTYEAGYNYVLKSGLHTEKEYPYVNDYRDCRCSEIWGRRKHSISGFTFIHRREEVYAALNRQPLTGTIAVYESFLMHRTPFKSRADLLYQRRNRIYKEEQRQLRAASQKKEGGDGGGGDH